MSPRILHLSTYASNGGAGRAVTALDSALRSYGVDSRLVTGQGAHFQMSRRLDRSLWRLQKSPVPTWRSPARFGSLSAKAINSSTADVVNLHWVTDGFLSIEEIGKIDKPVVWSMYDMWPFSGSEHYGVDSLSARWRSGYSGSNRPDDESGFDLDRWVWERKKAAWKPMHMVPASPWLAERVRTSALMGNWPVTRIPHVVDTATFAPMEQREARRQCGLPDSGPLLLFLASAGIADKRKGFDLLTEALGGVRHTHRELRIVVAGPPMPEYTSSSGVPILWRGNVDGDEALRALYCSADLLAVPSREDNMPLTAMEAQSCGVPVVAFDIGGLSDIVINEKTGLLVPTLDTKKLGAAISHLLSEQSLRIQMASEAERHAKHTWSPKVVAQHYLEVYSLLTGVENLDQ